MDIYREKLLDHYENPRNFGEVSSANYVAELENSSCGDVIKMYITENDGKIIDIHFTGEGCAVSIASASLLTEKFKGIKLSKIKDFTLEDLLELIGSELTLSRIKCANLSLETIKKALESKI